MSINMYLIKFKITFSVSRVANVAIHREVMCLTALYECVSRLHKRGKTSNTGGNKDLSKLGAMISNTCRPTINKFPSSSCILSCLVSSFNVFGKIKFHS